MRLSRGGITRFGSIDATDAGRTHRYSRAFDGLRSTGNAFTCATGFLMRYGLNLILNFTYFLENPTGGDQLEQADRRTKMGARVTRRRLGEVLGRPVEWAAARNCVTTTPARSLSTIRRA